MLDKLVNKIRGEHRRRHEENDGKPVAIPIGFKKPRTLEETVAMLIRNAEVRRGLQQGGLETFEEADDFDIPDDPLDPITPWETDFDNARLHSVERAQTLPPDSEKLTKGKSLLDNFRKKKAPSTEPSIAQGTEPSSSDAD